MITVYCGDWHRAVLHACTNGCVAFAISCCLVFFFFFSFFVFICFRFAIFRQIANFYAQVLREGGRFKRQRMYIQRSRLCFAFTLVAV